MLSEAYYNKEQYDESYAFAKEWIKREPENPRAFLQCGYPLMMAKDYEGAMELFKRGIELAPHYDPLYYACGCSLMKLGKKEEGKGYFLKALKFLLFKIIMV